MKRPRAKIKVSTENNKPVKRVTVGRNVVKTVIDPKTGKKETTITNLVTGNSKKLYPRKHQIIKTSKGIAVKPTKQLPIKTDEGVKIVGVKKVGNKTVIAKSKPATMAQISKTTQLATKSKTAKKKKPSLKSRVKGGVKGVGILGKGIVKGATKATKFVAKTVGKVALTPLLPFKKAMKTKLESDGINTKKMCFEKIIQTFHNKYVAKNRLEEVENLEMFESMRVYDVNHLEQDSIEPVILATVVSGTVKFFKDLNSKRKELKKAGKNPKAEMSVVDVKLAEETERIAQKSKEIEDSKEPVSKGEMKSKQKQYLLIGGAIAIILLVLFMVNRK